MPSCWSTIKNYLFYEVAIFMLLDLPNALSVCSPYWTRRTMDWKEIKEKSISLDLIFKKEHFLLNVS